MGTPFSLRVASSQLPHSIVRLPFIAETFADERFAALPAVHGQGVAARFVGHAERVAM